MKKLLLVAVAFIFALTAFSQDPPYSDNFDAYVPGAYVAEEIPDWWTTWSNDPGSSEDAQFSDAVSHSGDNSVLVDGTTDLVWKLGDKTGGYYKVDFYYYVADGFAGYYNFQHIQDPIGTEWAIEVYWNADGTADVHAGGANAATFTYTPGTWVYCEHFINLATDWAEFYVDGTLIHEWQWSLQAQGEPGANQLGAVNLYAGAQGSDTPMYYFDDVNYEVMPTYLYEDDFESYNVGDYISVVNPEWYIPWSGNPGSSDDAMVSDDQASSGNNSIEIVDGSDLIWLAGNKTAGEYWVNFEIFIPSDFAGYYNFQHTTEPVGTEWAMELYWNTDGTADLHAGGANAAAFNYEKDTWILCEHHIDLTNDWAEFYVDGVMIHEWQWSLQAQGEPGMNQLGGVDFYAGAQGSDVPDYYFDDIEYIELAGQVDPVIATSPVFFNVNAASGEIVEEILTIENSGAADLYYEIVPLYGEPSKAVTGVSLPAAKTMKMLTHNSTMEDPTPTPGGEGPAHTDDEVLLHYDGENSSAIGWNGAPITAKVAAMFPADMINEYAGMYLTSVDIFINDPSEDYFLKIWGMGNDIAPGELIHIQAITPTEYSWNTIELTDPVFIDGGDLWVGYQFTQVILDVFTPGCDAGPADPNGDWLSTGPGWGHLSDNPDLPFNWNIRAQLEGDPIPTWLYTDPVSGTVVPDATEEVTVYFDASMLPGGTYSGTLKVYNNDPTNPIISVPCAFHVEDSQNVPPTNPDAYTDCLDIVVTWDAPGGGSTEELIYDNNETTGAYSYVGYTMSTHMSPQDACQVLSVKYYTTLGEGAETAFNIHIFEWEGAQPASAPVYTQEGIEGIDEDWLEIDLSGENVFFSGDFVVGFGSVGVDVFLGYDGNLDNGRSWDYDNTSTDWASWTEAYLIRAVVEYSDGSVDEIAVSPVNPVIFNGLNTVRSNTGSGTQVDPIKNISFNRALLGYNVYEDDVMLNVDPIADLWFTVVEPGYGYFEYTITAVYDEGESLPVGPVGSEVKELDPVNNFDLYNEMGTSDVFLTWDPPGAEPQWLHWDDGEYVGGIGLTNGGDFKVSIRFDTDFLDDFDGMYLTEIAFVPAGDISTYNLNVWTGPTGSTMIVDQPVTGLTIADWNYIPLDTPVMINADEDLWIGYSIFGSEEGEYPAGHDAGPEVAGYGDLISLDGVNWVPISNYDIFLNWNIQGWVEHMTNGPVVNIPIAENSAFNGDTRSIPVTTTFENIENGVFYSPYRDFMGYNVYRNEELMTTSPIAELTYEDLGIPNGYYEYCVTAVYGDDCESEPMCDDVDIMVGIGEIDGSSINVYPNPANDFVNLEFDNNIKKVTIMNFTGQIVYTNENISTQKILRINTSTFEAGIYIVQIETSNGMVSKKVTIQ